MLVSAATAAPTDSTESAAPKSELASRLWRTEKLWRIGLFPFSFPRGLRAPPYLATRPFAIAGEFHRPAFTARRRSVVVKASLKSFLSPRARAGERRARSRAHNMQKLHKRRR